MLDILAPEAMLQERRLQLANAGMVESSPAGCSRRGAGAGTGAGAQSMRKQVECPDCAVCARVAV